MALTFTTPTPVENAQHHASAAASNSAVAADAVAELHAALAAVDDALRSYDPEGDDAAPAARRILLKAAAGAGKSFVLKRMVAEASGLGEGRTPTGRSVGITAFTNKQLWSLAESLGQDVGAENVALVMSNSIDRDTLPPHLAERCTIVSSGELDLETPVILATAAMMGMRGYAWKTSRDLARHEPLFDVLFVDEAWQLAEHLFDRVSWLSKLHVGVGDVGQLPPLDSSANPWRGDSGYNPYRAWPESYVGITARRLDAERDGVTWVRELPAVWRPTGEQLGLWQAFYPDWAELNCVAAPGDRSIVAGVCATEGADEPTFGEEIGGPELVDALMPVRAASDDVWRQLGTGRPTLLEIDGLPEAEAADIDVPLVAAIEALLDELVADGFELRSATYGPDGSPTGERTDGIDDFGGDPLIALLATRNQAVDDMSDVVERLTRRYDLPEGAVIASTVDSWQGQTNGITVAIHPLSGASKLDEFNSAFGRLAVTCTRATHGLLMVARAGLDDLLATAPARPGTPIGEPGSRALPRQTHERILGAFARGTLTI